MKFTKAVEFHKNGSLVKEIWKKFFLVNDEFVFFLNYDDKKEFVIVEKGFETDLSSIPRILRPFFDKDRVSWVLHDWIFTNKKIFFMKEWVFTGSRKCWFFEANRIYYRALLVEWVSRLEAILQLIGLTFGWWVIFYFYK